MLSIEALQNFDKGMMKGAGPSTNNQGGGLTEEVANGKKGVKLISPIVNPRQFVDMIEVMVGVLVKLAIFKSFFICSKFHNTVV